MHISLGGWAEKELDHLIREASKIPDRGERIDSLSRHFLGLAYEDATLIGDVNTPESFVINLGGVDCFTFIDYVEAMRLSGSFSKFAENLQKIRYKTGTVAFEQRNHFFTDWREYNRECIEDVTGEIGGRRTRKVKKTLNVKDDGTSFVPGIQPVTREISYISSDTMDESILSKMQTGDYAGIYSDKDGLDVSHVGIVIQKENGVYLRHVSLKERKVIDQDLQSYMSNKPGLIVLRPKASQ